MVGLGVLLGGAAAANAAVGHVRTQSTPLTVRSGPGTGFAAVGAVAKGAQARDPLPGQGHAGLRALRRHHVWNKLGEGRYVADAYTSSTEKAPTLHVPPTAGRRFACRLPGKACSANERSYPNGRVPRSALCSLRGHVRGVAATARSRRLQRAERAYEKTHGKPLCVTDSYRSYDQQVAVKASRGKWAATPGRSEHGLGHAARPVRRRGPVRQRPRTAGCSRTRRGYGWVHPGWAEAGGSLPEPWHWEFTG